MVIKSHGVSDNAESRAIIVACPNHRFQEAFAAFIHGELDLDFGEFSLISVTGGASILARPVDRPDDYRVVMSNIEVLLHENPSIKRIILINHEDCRGVPLSEAQSKEALRTAVKNIKKSSLWPAIAMREIKLELYCVGRKTIETAQLQSPKQESIPTAVTA